MENTLIPDLETNKPDDVVSSHNDDDRSSGPENENAYELRGAVGVNSNKSTREEAEEIHRPLEMEKVAEKSLQVNTSVATNDVALSQSDGLLINQICTVGTDFNKSPVEEITEMLKFLKVEEGFHENLQVNILNVVHDVALSQSDDLLTAVSSSSTLVDDRSSGSLNNFELRRANSDISSGQETKQMPMVLEMEESTEKDLDVSGSGSTNSVTLSAEETKQMPMVIEMEESAEKDLDVNGSGSTNSVTLSGEETKQMPMVIEMEESAEKDLDVNGSGSTNSVTLSGEETKQMPMVIEMEESAEKDLDVNGSGSTNSATLSQVNDLLIFQVGAAGTEADTSIGEDIKETSAGNDYEMEESAEKDLDVNGSGAAISVTLSQVSDLLINQVGAVGTEADTSIGEDIEETSGGIDYEMEESAEKDLDVNGSGAAISVTLSQVSDLLLNKGAAGTESDTSIGEDITEANAGKDYEVNISVTSNDVAISQSDAIVINHIGAVGIEFNKTTNAEIKEMPEVLAMEESSRNDLETNISVSNNDVALSQSDDLFIAVSSSSTISEDQSSDEGIKQPELLEIEESAENYSDMNRPCAANNVALFLSNDLLINQIGAEEVDSNKSAIEEITEKPELIEEEESAGNDLEANISVADNNVASSLSSDNLIAVLAPSTLADDQFPGEDIKEPELLNMEENAGNDLEVNTLIAANDVALFQSTDFINHNGVVGTDFNRSTCEVIKEIPKLPGLEEGPVKDPETNISVVDNDVALCQGNDLLIAVSSSTLAKNQCSGEDTEKIPLAIEMEVGAGNDYEVEESAEKDPEVNGSGATNSVTLSQVSDLLINQIGAVGTESDTSIGEDMEEMSAGNDYELEECAEKDDVNGSCASGTATLSQVNLLINQVGTVRSESDTSLGEDIKESSLGKDYEVNISVAANDLAISRSDDIVINQVGTVGSESDTSLGEDFKETSLGRDYEVNISVAADGIAISHSDDIVINQAGTVGSKSDTSLGEDIKETSLGKEYEVNISVAANDVAISRSDDVMINQVGAVGSESDTSLGEDTKETSLGKDCDVNISVASNDVAISCSDEIVINHIGAVGIEFNKTTDAEIKEMPKVLAMEESSWNDLETNISVANYDVALSQSDGLPIAVFSSSSTISKDQSSGEDIKEPELLNMEENAGNDLQVNTSSATNDVALSQSGDLLNHNGVVGTDFNRSTCEVIKEMPKPPELEEGAVKDPETNISVADNDVTLCHGDVLPITVSSSSMLSDNQYPGEDTEKMSMVLKMEDNDGKDLEMHQLEAADKDVLSQSHEVLITTFPSTVSAQQSSGHRNETRPELIGAVEIDADKPESEGALEMPKLHVTTEPEKSKKNVKFNLRKSLAWDSAFFTSDGVLDADELSTMMEGGVKNAKHQLPGIEEEVYRSMDSISTLESDNLSLECLEAELFEDIRASIQKSNRPSSNLNNSSIKVSSAKKDSPAKVTSSLKKVDIDSGKRPAARMKHITSSIPQPKIVSRVNSTSTSTLTKRASLSANHTKKDQDIARQPHVIQKGIQAAKTPTQGSKLIVPRRGVPKPLLSSKASPMGSSTAKTELTRPSSSHSNSSSCSSGDVKTSNTLSRKKTDSKPSKLTTTSVPKTPLRIITKNKPQPPANSRLSSHSVLSSVSSSISPASSISEWSLESSSSTTNNNLRSESRGSIDTGVSYRSSDVDASGHPALSLHPTGRISNQSGNQPISQSGSLARPPSVQPTGLRMPSPKIGFFDGGKSGARTPNGGNLRPQSKLPTGMPKTGATHSNPIISNGVKSGKIPPPKTGAAHTNPQKAAPKPSQRPKTKSSLVTSDASNTVTDGSRTPFAVKNSEAC